MPDAGTRLADVARAALRAAITDAGGNEVFCLGSLEDERITSIRVLARGNRQAVPALLRIPRPGEVVIHNHPSGHLTPSAPDLEIAAALGNDGVGFLIVDNPVERVYVAVEPHREPAKVKIDRAEIRRLLGREGPVCSRLPGYEYRPQQLQMAEGVGHAFNRERIFTVEAGTGTGKSLAYLIPAILCAGANRERVIVSTHTINLQEQLVGKDLPFLVKRAGLDARVALVKGRGNYLCQRKAAQVEKQPALIEDEIQRELKQVLDWSHRTRDGSLSDLSFRPRSEVWEQVVSENDNCLRARCPHYSRCFFYNARRAAAAADVLVVNHHLLMADLALRDEIGSYTQNAVLPPATRLIIDEAHHLEDVATTYFGARLSLAAIERTIGRLQRRRAESRGVLPALMVLLDQIDAPVARPTAQGAARRIEEHLLPHRADLLAQAEETFARLLVEWIASPRIASTSGRERKLRITAEVADSDLWRRSVPPLEQLQHALRTYAIDLGGLLERIDGLEEHGDRQILYLATELGALRGRLTSAAEGLGSFLEADSGVCRWIEIRERATGPTLSLHSAPIEVAPLLGRSLFEHFPTVVLTSATLSVERRFDYLHQRLGITDGSAGERSDTLRLESPFDYPSQALLLCPRDLAVPDSPGHDAALHAALQQAVEVSGGGAFLLFTSYGALRRAHDALAPAFRRHGLPVLRQGEGGRHQLLARFRAGSRAVLFGTDSFWEGVDVRGDALRLVVVTRLPFRVPTEPIEQARVEAIRERGGNPFAEHTLPQAVIKLQQGFGRLIRARDDRGCVLVLDSRLATKRYGRTFLDSLPPARRVIAPREQVFAELQRFFRDQQGSDSPCNMEHGT